MFRKLLIPLVLVLSLVISARAADPSPLAIHVEVTGKGRPMILIPGLSCGGSVWDGTVAHFKDTYECHVVTLPGFAGQPAVEGPFIEKAREDVLTYIRDHDLKQPIIMGHSLGAFLTFALGSSHPDQVGPLIAVDGVPFFPALLNPTATAESAKPIAENYRRTIQNQNAVQFAFGNVMFLSSMITNGNDLKAVAEVCNRSNPKTVGQAMYELMTTDLRPQVAAIKTPVLLLGSTATVQSPEEKKAVEERYRQEVAPIPNHEVIFAAKAKHFIQLDEPDFFYDTVSKFLEKASAAPGK